MSEQSPHAHSKPSTCGGGDFCCLEHSALESLAVPVVVHDAERILYVNASGRSHFGSVDPVGESVDRFVCVESASASVERRQLMLETDLRLADVDMKASLPGGRSPSLTVRGARLCYGEPPQRALVQLVRAIDGDVLVPFVPDAPTDVECGDLPAGACIHQAAFEALPVPAAVIDMTTLQRVNRVFRRLLKVEGSLEGAPVETIIHPDFLQAGAQRRHLVVELGAPVIGASVKFRAQDDSSVYATVNAARSQFMGANYMTSIMLHATAI